MAFKFLGGGLARWPVARRGPDDEVCGRSCGLVAWDHGGGRGSKICKRNSGNVPWGQEKGVVAAVILLCDASLVASTSASYDKEAIALQCLTFPIQGFSAGLNCGSQQAIK